MATCHWSRRFRRKSPIGLEHLEKSLGYSFQDPELIAAAVTHRSAGTGHNERLEFLGDAVLGYLIADALYHLDAEREGVLTRRRASLVRKETLADIARDIGLGQHLTLGSGERKSGGRERASILADALEAIIGAAYLDGGVTAARDLVNRLFAKRLAAVRGGDIAKDPKTRLQEHLQARRLALPRYEVHDVFDSPEGQSFVVVCSVIEPALDIFGQGANRRAAEQDAAARMLSQLEGARTADGPTRTI